MDLSSDTPSTGAVNGTRTSDDPSPPDVMATAVADAVVVPSSATAVPVPTVAATATTTTSPTSPPLEIVNAVPAASVHSSERGVSCSANITTVAAQVVIQDVEAPSIGVDTIPETRAEFLSATLHKPSPEAKLGITIAADARGDIRISCLSELGSVQHSPLRVGDKLLSINGKNCSDMDNGVAGELLRSLAGTITIIVHNEGGSPQMVETMVEKANPSATVGIGVHQTYRGTLNVSKVAASGLFAHSLVNVGDRVIAVNQVNCRRMEANTVVQMIRNAPKFVTLLTETHCTAGVVLAEDAHQPSSWLNDDARLQQHHFCYCIWMIIISLLVIGAIVLRPFA